jgi:hypothetical protein
LPTIVHLHNGSRRERDLFWAVLSHCCGFSHSLALELTANAGQNVICIAMSRASSPLILHGVGGSSA